MIQSAPGRLCFCSHGRWWRKPLKWGCVTYNLTPGDVTFRYGPDLNGQRRKIDCETNEVIRNLTNAQRFRSIEEYPKEISKVKGNEAI